MPQTHDESALSIYLFFFFQINSAFFIIIIYGTRVGYGRLYITLTGSDGRRGASVTSVAQVAFVRVQVHTVM